MPALREFRISALDKPETQTGQSSLDQRQITRPARAGQLDSTEQLNKAAEIETIGIQGGPGLFGAKSSHLPFGSVLNPNGLHATGVSKASIFKRPCDL